MSLLWTYDDQQSIKPISGNNEQKWNQLATEVQFVKLKELMGKDFYQDVKNNPDGTWNKKLIDGDSYTVDGVTYSFSGLKYVLAFLFYERYVMEIQVQDTYNGMMISDNVNAQHASLGAKKDIAQEMRRLAEGHWSDCKDFVIENSTEYPYAKFTKSGRIQYF
jgi:hypothetical protein